MPSRGWAQAPALQGDGASLCLRPRHLGRLSLVPAPTFKLPFFSLLHFTLLCLLNMLESYPCSEKDKIQNNNHYRHILDPTALRLPPLVPFVATLLQRAACMPRPVRSRPLPAPRPSGLLPSLPEARPSLPWPWFSVLPEPGGYSDLSRS